MPTTLRAAVAVLSSAAPLALAACTTPATTLRNPRTGQVVTCGGSAVGSLAGGVIGCSIQKGSDGRCVENHLAQGFVRSP